MEFKKYDSIGSSCQEKFIRSIHAQGYGDMEYIVQEKVHGVNLSFTTDGKEIVTAKRTEVLSEAGNFHYARAVRDRYHDAIISLFEELHEASGAESVTIFGELFGGAYPHPDVARDKQAKTVRKGVFYAPFNDFAAFDIFVGDTYLDPELAGLLFEKFGFMHARALFKGTLAECLSYPNEFPTTIPALYGLPEIAGNCCEGVVIRPEKAVFLQPGSRVIIKNKNGKFAGKENGGNRPSDNGKLSGDAAALLEEISTLITGNRLHRQGK